MATIKRLEDLQVWQEAKALAKELFDFVKKEPFTAYFKLREQINISLVHRGDKFKECDAQYIPIPIRN